MSLLLQPAIILILTAVLGPFIPARFGGWFFIAGCLAALAAFLAVSPGDIQTYQVFGQTVFGPSFGFEQWLYGLAGLICALALVLSLMRDPQPWERFGVILLAAGVIGGILTEDWTSLVAYWQTAWIAAAWLVWRGRSRAAQLRSGVVLGFGLLSTAFLAACAGAASTIAMQDLSPAAVNLVLLIAAISIGLAPFHDIVAGGAMRAGLSSTPAISIFLPLGGVALLARLNAPVDLLTLWAAASAMIAAILAALHPDLRGRLAYGGAAAFCLIAASLGQGSEIGRDAAAALAFCTVLGLALLQLAVVGPALSVKTTQMTELSGHYRGAPISALFGCLGAAMLIGVPGFAGHVGQSLAIAAMEHDGAALRLLGWVDGAYWAAFGAVVVVVTLSVTRAVFFRASPPRPPREADYWRLLALTLLALVGVFAGVAPQWLLSQTPGQSPVNPFAASSLIERLIVLAGVFGFGLIAWRRLDRPMARAEPVDLVGALIGLYQAMSTWTLRLGQWAQSALQRGAESLAMRLGGAFLESNERGLLARSARARPIAWMTLIAASILIGLVAWSTI